MMGYELMTTFLALISGFLGAGIGRIIERKANRADKKADKIDTKTEEEEQVQQARDAYESAAHALMDKRAHLLEIGQWTIVEQNELFQQAVQKAEETMTQRLRNFIYGTESVEREDRYFANPEAWIENVIAAAVEQYKPVDRKDGKNAD